MHRRALKCNFSSEQLLYFNHLFPFLRMKSLSPLLLRHQNISARAASKGNSRKRGREKSFIVVTMIVIMIVYCVIRKVFPLQAAIRHSKQSPLSRTLPDNAATSVSSCCPIQRIVIVAQRTFLLFWSMFYDLWVEIGPRGRSGMCQMMMLGW